MGAEPPGGRVEHGRDEWEKIPRHPPAFREKHCRRICGHERLVRDATHLCLPKLTFKKIQELPRRG